MIAKDKAEKFVAYWLAQTGSERSQCHQFWDSLLGEVLGVTDLKRFINAKKRYCLWLKKAMPLEIARSEFLSARVAAVLKAYGWPPDLTEPEIVSRLFALYAKLSNMV